MWDAPAVLNAVRGGRHSRRELARTVLLETEGTGISKKERLASVRGEKEMRITGTLKVENTQPFN